MTRERPLIADLFCGAGGAAMGLYRAGFDVVGFDVLEQPRYPFAFVLQDALTVDVKTFDAIWASPPCQAYTVAKTMNGMEGRDYPELIEATRDHVSQHGKPFIIENVVPAPIRRDVILCGRMFDLPLIRHRAFESNILLLGLSHITHNGTTRSHDGFSSFANGADYITVAGHNFSKEDGQRAMGIGWMTKQELSQAIPPMYSEFLGRQLIMSVRHET